MIQLSIKDLLVACALVASSAFGSAYFTKGSQDWYKKCTWWTPPNKVFAVVWPCLYAVLAFVLYHTFREIPRSTLSIHLQLATLLLNTLWCYLFFQKKQVGAALAVLVLNVTVSVLTMILSSKWYTLLLIPYAIWLEFALILNAFAWNCF